MPVTMNADTIGGVMRIPGSTTVLNSGCLIVDSLFPLIQNSKGDSVGATYDGEDYVMRRDAFAATLLAVILLSPIAILLESCHSPIGASGAGNLSFQTDTVSYTQITAQAGGPSLYIAAEVKWGLALDHARADSLAKWFAGSGFSIEDMWFPASGPLCARSYNTYNFVYVRLARADTSIDTLGFAPTSPGDGCFPTWVHYKFY